MKEAINCDHSFPIHGMCFWMCPPPLYIEAKKPYTKKLTIYGGGAEEEKWLCFLMTVISLCFYRNLYISNESKNKKTQKGWWVWIPINSSIMGTERGAMISQNRWGPHLDAEGIKSGSVLGHAALLNGRHAQQTPSTATDKAHGRLFWSDLSGPTLSISPAVTVAAST